MSCYSQTELLNQCMHVQHIHVPQHSYIPGPYIEVYSFGLNCSLVALLNVHNKLSIYNIIIIMLRAAGQMCN